MIFLKNAPERAVDGAVQDATTDLTINTAQGQAYILDKLAAMDQQTPSYNSTKNLKNAIRASLTQKLNGFLGIYAGYFAYSDHKGLLSFPLRHANPKLYIAITPNIALIKIKDTISHREFIINDQNPTKLYVCERKQEIIKKPEEQDSQQAGKAPATRFYWDIQEAPLPADNKINPLTVVILTKPKNIYVPLGHFLTSESPHLVLPDFYVMGNVDNNEELLQAIGFTDLFEKINTEEKKASDKVVQKMITNI